MQDNNFFEPNSQLINDYINHISTICVVLIDRQMKIRECNLAFQTITGTTSKPIGEKLISFLHHEDQNIEINPPEKGFQKKQFTLLGEAPINNSMTGYFARTNDGYLLLCEKAWITEDEIFKEISKINNELANITRELNKKNAALEKANDTINRLLREDPLTGIANRLHFYEYFKKMQALALRHKTPLSLVMTDLDYFKTINDRYGHQAGDEVLIAFARLLQENCREEDLPVRYGGEEFCILLVATALEQACSQAERVRSQLEKTSIGESELKITASFGVATLIEEESLDNLIKRADDALYEAKASGRNQVKTAT